MNVLNIQKDCLKALLAGERVKYYCSALEDKVFLLFGNGSVSYFIPEDEMMLNFRSMEECLYTLDERVVETICPGNRLKGTDEYRVAGIVRKYLRTDSPEAEVYVNTELLKHFKAPVLYQSPDPKSMIVVAEDRAGGGETVVGVVMPYKLKDQKEYE